MLTFEKIRDLERAERETKQLQKLPDSFFEELRAYVQKKEQLKDKTSMDILELENVKNTIKRFLESRERKMLEAALYSVRTGLPSEHLTPVEEKACTAVAAAIRELRSEVLEELQKPAKERKIVFVVKKTLPPFVGPDLKIHELKEGETVVLPKTLNDLLLKEGVLEQQEE